MCRPCAMFEIVGLIRLAEYLWPMFVYSVLEIRRYPKLNRSFDVRVLLPGGGVPYICLV